MRQVVDAVDERNLLLVAFDSHVLAIDDEEAAETFRIAVRKGDIVVVREPQKLPHNSPIRCIDTLPDPACQCADAGAFQVCQEERFL